MQQKGNNFLWYLIDKVLQGVLSQTFWFFLKKEKRSVGNSVSPSHFQTDSQIFSNFGTIFV